MVKSSLRKLLHRFGYDLRRIQPPSAKLPNGSVRQPPAIAPVWPLPRRPGGPSDAEIREEFSKYDFWHYAYKFVGGVQFDARHSVTGLDDPNRAVQRFGHFMPYVVEAQGG